MIQLGPEDNLIWGVIQSRAAEKGCSSKYTKQLLTWGQESFLGGWYWWNLSTQADHDSCNPMITTAGTIPILLNYNKTVSFLLIFILITLAKIKLFLSISWI